jgi:hypothetical protein
MAIAELEELFKQITTPEDRALFEQLVERNEAVRERVISGEDLTRSLLDGDPAAAARIEARKQAASASSAAPRPPAADPSTRQPGIDLSRLDELVAAKVQALLDSQLAGTSFNEKVKGLVKATADEIGPVWRAQSTKQMDEIYTIRRANEKEFGKELDTAVFTKFIDDAKAATGKIYGSYVDAYNDFVKEERISARIAKGIAEGVAAHPKLQDQLPGTTLTTGTTMAARMVQANKLSTADTERGKAVDAGARALAQMKLGRVGVE